MSSLTKQLSDTDSEYCVANDCTSHQKHFHLGQWNTQTREAEFVDLFGNDFVNGASIHLNLSKSNIIFNLLCHFTKQTAYHKRIAGGGNAVQWNLGQDWLMSNIDLLDQVFSVDKAEFVVSLSKEASGPKRVSIRSITNLALHPGGAAINLQLLFFAGDVITLSRNGNAYDLRVDFPDQNVVARVKSWLSEEGPAAVDYRDEFITWLYSEGKKKKTVDNYMRALDPVCEPIPAGTDGSTHTAEKWPGIYEYLTGKRPRRIYSISRSKDLVTEYGMFDLLFAADANQGPMNKTKYDACRDWALGSGSGDNHRILKYAFAAYKDFLAWREGQDKNDRGRVNVLNVALNLFKNERKTGWLVKGLEVNFNLREYFDQLTEQSIAALTEGKIKELFTGTHDASGSLVLRTVWSITGQTYGGTIDPGGDAQKVQKIVDYLKRLKHDTAIASTFWADNDPLRPSGFGSSVTTELLMKFHPDQILMYAKEGCVTLNQLGLIEFEEPNANKAQRGLEFKLVQAAGTIILAKMHAMNIDKYVKADGTGDGSAADYFTVNEFLCFVHEKFNEIQNEVMNMSLETPTNATNAGNKDWAGVLSANPDDMMNRLVAALLTKPFAILAGASGTGKSRMVRKLAYMTCLNTQLQPDSQTKKPIENFRMVQVKPNWHDSSDLLGYRSSVSGSHDYVSTDFVRFILKAHAFPSTPFFVCLDEMNLAPVEHYFAEFLSASESARVEDGEYITDPIIDPGEFYGNIANLDPQGYSIPQARKDLIEKRGLYLPKNLFVVGTVNMDDTTGGFSRKVLDRAMTLEMNEVNFDELQSPVELRLMDKVENGQVVEKGLLLKAPQIASFIDRVDFKPASFDNSFKAQLEDIRSKLATTPLAFAFRFARECVQYRDAMKILFPNDPATNKTYEHTEYALDHMFLMKILPRLVGNVDDRQAIVNTLNAFFGTLTGHGLSAKKLHDMLDAANANGGFLSYYL